MVSGDCCWNTADTSGMSWRSVVGRRVLVYDGVPETAYAALRASAVRSPWATALVDDDGKTYTYGQFLELTDRFAVYLSASFDIGCSDRVGLLLDTSVEFCCAFFACNRLGAVCVPLSTKYREDEVCTQVKAADLKLLLLDERFSDWSETLKTCVKSIVRCNRAQGFGFELGSADRDVPYAADAAAVAAMLFTSGTTSRAKGVLISNLNVMQAAAVYQRLEATTSSDVTVIPIPIYHVTGLFALLVQYVLAGACIILHRRFNAHRVLTCVKDQGVTHIHAAPTALAKLLECANEFPNLPTLRLVLTGSSTAPAPLLKRWHAWLPTCTFKTVYGLTETTSPACLFPADAPTSIYIGSSGKPVPGMQLSVLDDDGHELPAGEVGEVVLRGATVTLGYELAEPNPAAADAFSADGWFRTGDMGYVNSEGLLWIVGRRKDVINRGGEKIWCCSLEDRLRDVEGVADACVVGISDDMYGEVPCAAIVADAGSGLTEESLKQIMRDRVARFEVPEHIVFVSAIPQTVGDKLDRRAVRALVLSAIDKR